MVSKLAEHKLTKKEARIIKLMFLGRFRAEFNESAELLNQVLLLPNGKELINKIYKSEVETYDIREIKPTSTDRTYIKYDDLVNDIIQEFKNYEDTRRVCLGILNKQSKKEVK